MLRSRRGARRGGWRLYCAANAPVSAPRFAVVVARRYVRGAVERNRIRRLLREYFRQELRLRLPPMDYLMRTVSALPFQDARQLREECRALFAEATGVAL